MQEFAAIENTATTATITTESTARLVYILYLIGIVIAPVGIVGVILAYSKMYEAPYWLQSHYCFQARTFWMGMLFLLPGILMLPVMALPGYLILLAWAIWLILRCSRAMKELALREAHPNPTGWLC